MPSNDQAYVHRVRRIQRFQLRLALLICLLGIVYLAAGMWFYSHKQRSLRAVLEDPTPKIEGTTPQLAAAMKHDQARTEGELLGLHTGLPVGATIAVGAMLVVLGLIVGFGGKKDRLLVKYYDLAQQKGDSS